MKRVLMLAVILLALAQPAAATWIELEGAIVTDYMWRGFNQLEGRPAVQPSITLIGGNTGLALNVWGSWGIAHRDLLWVQEMDEFDVSLSWYNEFDDTALELGYFHANWYTRDGWPDIVQTMAREVFIGLHLIKLPLDPFVRVNYEIDKFEGNDLYIEGGLGYTILESRQPIELSLHGGYMEAEWADVKNVTDVTFGVTVPVQGEYLTYTPWFRLTWIPVDHVNNNEFEVYAGLAISWTD